MGKKYIISGGGTGGHIFPALAIANELKERDENAEFLFVGADNRMEMEKVPANGYNIVGLPVVGFPRKPGIKLFKFFFALLKSMKKARAVVKKFNPDVAIGVGGYASGPVLRVASKRGIPCVLQEQNSYAGITNKMLAKKVTKICVAYEKMERYFPNEKIVITGNPIRKNLVNVPVKSREGYEFFNVQPTKKVLLIIGGSLGARTLNNAVLSSLDLIKDSDMEIIWQTGKIYYQNVLDQLLGKSIPNLHPMMFIDRMDLAYSIADVVVSRAGALSISELCLTGKPSILVPSPNVAEDHQTKNAMALVEKNAAIMVRDAEAEKEMLPVALDLLKQEEKLLEMSKSIKKMAFPKATENIAEIIMNLGS